MEAIIRGEHSLSEFAEREKKESANSLGKKESQRIHLGYPRTG